MTEAVYALNDPVLAAQLRARMTPLAGRLITMRYIATLGAGGSLSGYAPRPAREVRHRLRRFRQGTRPRAPFRVDDPGVADACLAYAEALARAGQTAEAASQADAARRAAEETGVDFVIRRASELGSTLGRSR